MTLTIQIGNSDDKLTQRQWADFVETVAATIAHHATATHFFGASAGWQRWQNACWVFDCDQSKLDMIKAVLSSHCILFQQDSIAVTVGTTELVGGAQ